LGDEHMVRRFLRDEAGASAAEYAMLLILLGCAVILGSIAIAVSIGGGMGRFADFLDPVAAAGGGDASPPDPGSSGSGGAGSGSSNDGAGQEPTPASPNYGCGQGQASNHNPNCKK